MQAITIALALLVASASAFSVRPAAPARTSVQMAAEPLGRRAFGNAMAAAIPLVGAAVANADIDYAGLPYLGGSEKIDVNNANVRVYAKLPGMYPNAAGRIVTNGPYKSVGDLYNIKGITENEKKAIKKYESRLITLEPSAMYVIDRVNNGLYR
jgi:photosystem II PsbU protein